MGQTFHTEGFADHVKFSSIVEAHEMLAALDGERLLGEVNGELTERQLLLFYGYWIRMSESGHFHGEDNRTCALVAEWLARAIEGKWRVFIEF